MRRFLSSATQQQPVSSRRRSSRRWFLIGTFGGLGTAYAWYMWDNYRDASRKYQAEIAEGKNNFVTPAPLRMALYRAIPVNAITAFAGWFSHLEIPRWLRGPLYRSFSLAYGVNLEEAELKDPLAYPTFNAFFTRNLRPGIRPIDQDALMVSPTDCRVLAVGRIDKADASLGSQIFPEQIKGVTYPLDRLVDTVTLKELEGKSFKKSTSIYYATLYLAPGGYHRFHAPTSFDLQRVTRFPGEVLSVAPWMFNLVPALPCINERAVLAGKWKHGPFAMVPVGATSVRSIRLVDEPPPSSKRIPRGDLLGMFEMGSAIVLIFEGPSDAEWTCKPGDRLQLGQAMLRNASSKKSGWFWW